MLQIGSIVSFNRQPAKIIDISVDGLYDIEILQTGEQVLDLRCWQLVSVVPA